ncbi:MAG: metalloregulator ArsR/SmtB family transcription factor [Rhodobacteraceae bacterium]|nr:metalloregulator ArsR/SmtB family transcription factor [Paracoccaceae bacterium]
MTTLVIAPVPPRQALPDAAQAEMASRANEASAYLKSLAHEGRLMILCHLSTQERSVGELETLLNVRQSAVSQMLARLREDGLVSNRRDGKTIYYSLADTNTQQVIGLLYSLFCDPDNVT